MTSTSSRPLLLGSTARARGRDRHWQPVHLRRLAVSDTVVVVLAVALAQVVRLGSAAPAGRVPHTLVPVLLGLAWLGLLALLGTRGRRTVGNGVQEYRRVLDASLRLLGLVAVAVLLLDAPVSRGYLAVALPLGTVGLLASRWSWRRWLSERRSEGTHGARVLVVGSRVAAAAMQRQLTRDVRAGYRVVGVCVPGLHPVHGDRRGRRPGDTQPPDDPALPVLGDATAVRAAILASGADTVVVSNTEHLGPDGMRTLAWELDELDVDLVVAPGVVDVAGSRLAIHPVAELPLLHVEQPQYEGAGRLGKWLLDVTLATVGLVLTAPVLLVAAIAVKLTSPGPLFHRADRVGLRGTTFPMLKLRSMVVDADARVSALAAANDGAGPLFKMHDDPRVTPVGRILRRFSIDELPQLVNVLRGQMSIVGPRPPLPRETAAWTGDVHRRMLVKPGITGLWQVSGRSDLSWEDSVRLDLSYVENWSLVGDLVIVGRTARAVARSEGAY